MVKIGVDIGHGSDTFPPSKGFSKSGTDYHEHDHNSLLGKEVKRLLEVNGFDVYMAQKPNSKEVPLNDRGPMYQKEKCDLVISLHANWNDDRNVNGRCGFYWHANSKTKKLVQDITSNMKDMGYELHGNGMHASERGSWTNLYITRALPMDSILIEHGFMNGSRDFDYVFGDKQDKHIKDMAIADVKAICEFFGKSFKSKGKATKPKPSKPSKPSKPKPYTQDSKWPKLENKGPNVGKWQRKIKDLGYYKGKIDNSFGPETDRATRAFQKANDLAVDGQAGPASNKKADELLTKNKYPIPNVVLQRGATGNNVKDLQRALHAANFKPGKIDGSFGPQTEDAVRRFQKVHDPKYADGSYGPRTRSRLDKVVN